MRSLKDFVWGNKKPILAVLIFLVQHVTILHVFSPKKTLHFASYLEDLHVPFAHTFTSSVKITNAFSQKFVWEKKTIFPFDEGIISWNALRPLSGSYKISVQIFYDQKWSEIYPVAEWSSDHQRSFGRTKNPDVHIKHARLEMQGTKKAYGFRVVLESAEKACLQRVHLLHFCASNTQKYEVKLDLPFLPSVSIPYVPLRSQLCVPHPRNKDFCSPTASTILIDFYRMALMYPPLYVQGKNIACFAERVRDASLDIYGNWMLNIAEAYQDLKRNVMFRVERLNSFKELHSLLCRSIPVAVSVRGSMRGGAKPYPHGHFIVVIGWDCARQKVLCIDPAFLEAKLTYYSFEDFIKAWGKSRNLSYTSYPFFTQLRGNNEYRTKKFSTKCS